jgi:metal-dependent amidase/aminoacylase/carboxypeptidase family protein
MEKHGFKVERKLHLETAWRATFSHGSGGRTIGLNSEVSVFHLNTL